MVRICSGRSASCFINSFMLQVISEKNLCSKGFTCSLSNCDSYKSWCKFDFILFLSFCRIQKQESNFQQVGGLVTITISPFCLWRVGLCFKDIPNSTVFYREIFYMLILSCYNPMLQLRIPTPWQKEEVAENKEWFWRLNFKNWGREGLFHGWG